MLIKCWMYLILHVIRMKTNKNCFFFNLMSGRNCWKLFGNAMYDSDGVDLGEENADFEPLGQPYVECAFLETLDVNL